jgi:hypothetical protein
VFARYAADELFGEITELGVRDGAWSGAGVLRPEALPPRPFLDLLNDYGSPWAREERTPA